MEARFSVPEMVCGACEGSIRRALASLQGVRDVAVDLDRKTVSVDYAAPASEDLIRARIEAAGFDVFPAGAET